MSTFLFSHHPPCESVRAGLRYLGDKGMDTSMVGILRTGPYGYDIATRKPTTLTTLFFRHLSTHYYLLRI